MNKALALAAALALLALAAVPALGADGERGAPGPRLAELEYYEDLEDGFRYNVAARIKGKADRASARIGKVRSPGRESRSIGGGGKGKTWFFRKRKFVRAVRVALETTGRATVTVRVRGKAGRQRKRCTLMFQPDPQFGDYARGECRKR